MPDTDFLTNRAASLRRVAEQYEELARMCQRANVKPMSGDLMTEKQWANNVNYLKPDFCPRSHQNAIILTMRHGAPEPGAGRDIVVAALTVHGDGYFCATLIGGNHDMMAGELEMTLDRIRRTPLARAEEEARQPPLT